jgi:hypothetical protein
MSGPATYLVIILSMVASTWCWWRIWRSDDPAFFKVALTIVVALPILGPFFYLFADMPPRHRETPQRKSGPRRPQSAFLKRWNEREHVYLGWASLVFWALGGAAYWMNDWHPGRIIEGRFGTYTTVDVLFFSLLIGAVLTFAAALRAKVLLMRELKEALTSQPTLELIEMKRRVVHGRHYRSS